MTDVSSSSFLHPSLAFLAGVGCDASERTLERVLAFDDAELEATHDFIQWLFPLDEPSAYNPDAPVLDVQDFQALASHERAREGLLRGLERMLRFYRFEPVFDAAGRLRVLTACPRFAERAAHWAPVSTHNDLRVTRMLRCLSLCGEHDTARRVHKAFAHALLAHRGEEAWRTLQHWDAALFAVHCATPC